MGDGVVAGRRRVLLRVGGVDAVDLRRLHQHVAFELGGAQRRAGVGGEERIAGAAGEQHDALLGEVVHGLLAGIGLDHRGHGDARHGARGLAERGELRLERDDVHDRGEHAHRVGRRARQAHAGDLRAAEDVAAADDHRDLDAELDRVDDVLGDAAHRAAVDAEGLRCPSAPRPRASPERVCREAPPSTPLLVCRPTWTRAARGRPMITLQAGRSVPRIVLYFWPAWAATSAAKSAFLLLDALAESIAHEAGHLDRAADGAFGSP